MKVNIAELSYANMDTIDVAFYPFGRPCPICNEHLDCITEVHCAKHNMTRNEFIQQYAPDMYIGACDNFVLPENVNLSTVEDFIIEMLKSNPGKCITPRQLKQILRIRVAVARLRLSHLESLGILDGEYIRVKGGSLSNGIANGHTEKSYKLREVKANGTNGQ